MYGLTTLNGSSTEISLFKITVNETTINTLPFDFSVSYKNSLLYIMNSTQNAVPNSRWQLKANATELKKLICLSVHWDQNNIISVNRKGKLYVNGKEIVSFYTANKLSHN